jgi:hypothetical protein
MAAKAIHEAKGKQLLNKFLGDTSSIMNVATYNKESSWEALANANPWLLTSVRISKLKT